MHKIIAEFCGNHEGDMGYLKEMVHAAKESGAWAGKIQSFFAKDLSTNFRSQYERIRKQELTWKQHKEFSEECKKVGLIPMTSVYTPKYTTEIWNAGIQWIKIGSPHASDLKLISAYKALGFKVIVSTGGHDLKTLPFMSPVDGYLHCVSKYPHSPWEANLSRLIELKTRLGIMSPSTPVGVSFHTSPVEYDWWIPDLMAQKMGAKYFEHHFILHRKKVTKDIAVSLTPDQMKLLSTHLNGSDALELSGKLGAFWSPQTHDERDLINKYAVRFKC